MSQIVHCVIFEPELQDPCEKVFTRLVIFVNCSLPHLAKCMENHRDSGNGIETFLNHTSESTQTKSNLLILLKIQKGVKYII